MTWFMYNMCQSFFLGGARLNWLTNWLAGYLAEIIPIQTAGHF